MAALGIVLVVILGVTACVLVLVTIQIARGGAPSQPTAADFARARRRAEELAFREAELAELRSQGPLVDRQLSAIADRLGASRRSPQAASEAFDTARAG